MHKTAQTFHFIVSKQPPTVKLLSPTSSKVLEPPLVRTPPGLQPHLRGFCPQTPAKPISSPLPQKDLPCCLQDTNALHFLPSLFSGKLLQCLVGFFFELHPFPSVPDTSYEEHIMHFSCSEACAHIPGVQLPSCCQATSQLFSLARPEIQLLELPNKNL